MFSFLFLPGVPPARGAGVATLRARAFALGRSATRCAALRSAHAGAAADHPAQPAAEPAASGGGREAEPERALTSARRGPPASALRRTASAARVEPAGAPRGLPGPEFTPRGCPDAVPVGRWSGDRGTLVLPPAAAARELPDSAAVRFRRRLDPAEVLARVAPATPPVTTASLPPSA